MEKIANLKENSRNLGPEFIKKSGTQFRNFRNLGLPPGPKFDRTEIRPDIYEKVCTRKGRHGTRTVSWKIFIPKFSRMFSLRSQNRLSISQRLQSLPKGQSVITALFTNSASFAEFTRILYYIIFPFH